MSKKNVFIGIVRLFVFVIIVFPAIAEAEQYYDQYPGNGFMPQDESLSYYRDFSNCHLRHNDTSDAYYICPVNFNVPDDSVYFIKSIGMRFKDNLTDGHITVYLYRENLYTGAIHTVAYWTSLGSSPTIQTASKGTESGVKLVDTKKFCYWLMAYFYRDEDVNPSFYLILYQVRIHYGT